MLNLPNRVVVIAEPQNNTGVGLGNLLKFNIFLHINIFNMNYILTYTILPHIRSFCVFIDMCYVMA